MGQNFSNWIDGDDRKERLDQWRRQVSGKGKWLAILALLVGLGLYTISGIFTVGPSDVGLITRFGAYNRTVGPGLHFRLPTPFERVRLVDVLGIRKEEIGFRSAPRHIIVDEEALMLTGDGIVHVEVIVHYRVHNPQNFVFHVDDPTVLVRQATEAILRVQVVRHGIDDVMTVERAPIAMETKQKLQELLDFYQTGIEITTVQLQDVTPPRRVIAAFDDVSAAMHDRERLIKIAERHAMEVIPIAEGEAFEIIEHARGVREGRIKAAEGSVARFNKVLEQYLLAPDVTAARLYLETMEAIMPGMKKIILSHGATGILPLLDLERLAGGGEK
ncbi:FtsH protease activity modulator HflK [Candidatus Bipolaricaulota bacterium]|nr:FtsH protease activity modulator HflK [Candidatus Bipolaricaulota bacterium]HBR09886.1 FtsH protease activity modulator HflK [Candidatus Acetothermia bacterium]